MAKYQYRERFSALYIGSVRTGKSRATAVLCDKNTEDVLVYDTPGDDTFAHLPVFHSTADHAEALRLYNANRKNPLDKMVQLISNDDGNGRPLFYEAVNLWIDNTPISGYLQGMDAQNVYLRINHPQSDVVVLGNPKKPTHTVKLPTRNAEERLELITIAVPRRIIGNTDRVLKARLSKSYVMAWNASPKAPTLMNYLPRLKNCMFILSDASVLFHADRQLKQQMHSTVTEVRHQGVDVVLVVHKFATVNPEFALLVNYIVFRKQDVAPEIPRALKDELLPEQSQKIEAALQEVEGHPNRFHAVTVMMKDSTRPVMKDVAPWDKIRVTANNALNDKPV